MYSVGAGETSGGLFLAKPEHGPRSKSDKYKRLHYYVCRLGVNLSNLLMETLLDLRREAYKFPDPALQQAALKAFNDQEYTAAVKQLLCIWLHQEAMDQGGDAMLDWLRGFLRLGFGATDILIPSPRAVDVLNSYGDCQSNESLCQEAALKACRALGFGQASGAFAPYLRAILTGAGQIRQAILKEALLKPLEEITADLNQN